LASFVCLECAGLHRKLGTHICVVRSISHDQFEEKDVECVEYSGNEVVNEIFEGHLQKSTMDGINIKPVLGSEVARRERFIRQKYVDLYFYRKRAHYQHISEVNKLMASVRKPLKSSGGGSKASPTKPFRKRLKMFLNEDPPSESGRDTIGCSTTVGNTTNTSRTRTITERDDSHRSDAPTKLSKKKRSSTKKRTSKRKKNPKKSSSQCKLKQLEDQTDPMFGMPFERGVARIGESSVPQKQPSLRNLKEPMHTAVAKERNDLSGMILVFDEESFNTVTDSPQRGHGISMDLEAYRHSTTAPSASSCKEPTIDAHEMQNDLLEGFTRKSLINSTSEGGDCKDLPASLLRGDFRRYRSEITVDETTRKHKGPNSPDFTGRKTLTQIAKESHSMDNSAKNPYGVSTVKATTPLRAHLSKDASRNMNSSNRDLNIPYLNSQQPNSLISVEGIISEETSYGFGDHTVNCMSGTGDSHETSFVAGSIGTVNGFRVIDSEFTQPLSSGPFTEKFKNKKETDVLIKSQSQHSFSKKDLDDDWDQADDSYELNRSNKSLRKSNRSLQKERSSRSIGNKSNISADEYNPRMYLQRPKSQRSIDCGSPPLKKKKSTRSLTNKSNTSTSVDTPASQKKSRRLKSQGITDSDSPNSKKLKKKSKSSRSLSNKSHSSAANGEHVLRKKLRKPKSKERMDCDSPASTKNRTSKKRTKKKSKKSRSRSKSTSRKEDINLRRQALLDEWEKLKDENQREFERLRTENQRKFADFDQHYSQHIHILW